MVIIIKEKIIHFFGKRHTKKSKDKISKSLTERYISVKTRKEISKRMMSENNPLYIDGCYREKQYTKRKNLVLGFEPINEWFEGSEAHHIDHDLVIFISKEIHRSMYHNLKTGQNMKQINNLAFEFYTIQWIEEHNITV